MPMPSGYLFQQSKSYKKTKDNKNQILFATTTKKQYLRRLDGGPCHVYSNTEYFNDQIRFSKGLDQKNRNRLLVRIYQDDAAKSYEQLWQVEDPNIRFDRTPEITQSLNDSQIFVVDHFGTTWLEALNLDIPFIIYVRTDDYDFHSDFEKLLIDLKSVSVFHEDPKSAADTINSIAQSLDDWWLSDNVRSAIAAAKRQMAFAPTNSVKLWRDELKRL